MPYSSRYGSTVHNSLLSHSRKVVEVALTWAIYSVMSPSYKFFFPLKNPPFADICYSKKKKNAGGLLLVHPTHYECPPS